MHRNSARKRTDSTTVSDSSATPGRRSRAADRYAGTTPVQRKASGAAPARRDPHTVASEGVAGPGSSMPYLDALQAAFGHHDLSGVRAHNDEKAAGASRDLGAVAYATGNDVAFGGAPDLFTAAHEAAHVVQQRAGVHLRGGIGSEGDLYEQHADAVAAGVVRGESVEGLLDQMAPAGGGGASSSAVQRSTGGGAGTAAAAEGEGEGEAAESFVPQVEFDSEAVITQLGESEGVNARVVNAASAPKGTKYNWTWGETSEAFERVGIGTLGAATRFAFKPKKVADGTIKAKASTGGASDTAALSVGVDEPTITTDHEVIPGIYGVKGAAIGDLKPGDRVKVNIHIDDTAPVSALSPSWIKHAFHSHSHVINWGNIPGVEGGAKDDAFVIDETTRKGNTITYDIRCSHLGSATLVDTVALPGAAPVPVTMVFQCKNTPVEHFLKRCDEASQRHTTLAEAASSKIESTFVNYDAAYKNIKAALDADAAQRKFLQDLFMGLLFAGIGGIAGGAVAKGFAEPTAKALADRVSWLTGAYKEATVGAITDAAKDLAKYTARIPSKVAARHTVPTVGKPKDPITWRAEYVTLGKAEMATVSEIILGWKTQAREVVERGGTFEGTFDPLEAVNASTTFNTLPVDAAHVPSAAEIEQAMWAAYLAGPGHHVHATQSLLGGTIGYVVGPGGNANDRLDALSKQLEEEELEENDNWRVAATLTGEENAIEDFHSLHPTGTIQ